MKSYTDLEQSKKLAEFLPIESADMFCADVFNKEKETHSYNFHILSTWGCNTFEELKGRENKFLRFIPCWSLAALMDVLDLGDLFITPQGWVCQSYINLKAITSDHHSNPIDACYEIILRLHELKLL